jgi:hypothetical protein
LLPAALGNRSLFSLEECDNCNEEYGDAFDVHLVRMLDCERAFWRVRTREGPPKLKGARAKASVGQSQDGGLHVVVDNSDDSVSLSMPEPGRVILRVRPSPFQPVAAFRALARSAWLGLDAEERRALPWLLAIARGLTPVAPIRFFDLSLTRSRSKVTLTAWRPRGGFESLPDLLLRLHFTNRTLLIPFRRDRTLVGSPLPAEELPSREDSGVEEIIEVWDDSFVGRKTRTFHIGYSNRERERTRPARKASPSKSNRRKVSLHLVLPGGGTLRLRSCFLEIQELSRRRIFLRFSGGELAGALEAEGVPERDSKALAITAHAAYLPHSCSAATALRGGLFLWRLMNSGGSVSIEDLDRKLEPTRLSVRPRATPEPKPEFLEWLRWLVLINHEYKADLRLPMEPCDEFLRSASDLATAITAGNVVDSDVVSDGTLSERDARELVGLSEIVIVFRQWAFEIDGHSFEAGTVRAHFHSPRVTASPMPDGMSRVEIHADRVTRVFERWAHAADPFVGPAQPVSDTT